MRLTQIKLSGFKSFVDTTLIPTPSQLVGVVGPNGCGKSNIIDAVRWVLGESRASELRGGSMQDVIFNGSGQRKPSARASVELTFDNSEGRVQGQWGTYTEISVRRELTRDGTSGYFINGQQVRRRDINDIFLGTGLGARGYAIIGQGMINRLIEAKPEELRVYLEEAAGVSRYKERRKETESRLRDTNENLVRLEDILQELEQQLARLEVQAEIARQYRDLQDEGEKKQHALWWLREQNARQEQRQHALAIEQAQTAVEAAMADMRSTEARLEALRQAQLDQTDAVQKAQAQLYQHATAVNKIEAEIHHAKTAQQRLEQRQQQLQAQQLEWQQLRTDSSHELELKQDELEEFALRNEEALGRLEECQQRLNPLESAQDRALKEKEHLQERIQQTRQHIALATQRLSSAQVQQEQLQQRQQRFEADLSQLQVEKHLDSSALKTEWLQAKERVGAQQLSMQTLLQQESALQQAQEQTQQILHEQERSYTQIQAQLQAMEQLQAQLQRHEQMAPWLEQYGLDQSQPFWQRLQVDEGWATALEAVLGLRLQALTVDELNGLADLNSVPPTRLWLVEPFEQEHTDTLESQMLSPLSAYVRAKHSAWQDALNHWVAGWYVVPTLTQALDLRSALSPTMSLVTPEGHIVQSHQVMLYTADTEQAGILARQQEIEQQHKALKAQLLHVQSAKEKAVQAQQALVVNKEEQTKTRTRLQELTHLAHELQLHYHQTEQKVQQQRERLDQVQVELQEINELKVHWQETQEQAVQQREEQALILETLLEQHDEQQQNLTELNDQLQVLRAQLRELEQQSQSLQYNQNLTQARVDELLRSQQQAQELAQRAQIELAGLVDEYENTDVSELHQQLQEALEQRVHAEDLLHTEQKQLTELTTQLHELQHSRHQTGDGLEPLRQQVTQLQLAEQSARLTVEQYAAQLDAQHVNRHALAAFMQEQEENWHKVTWLQSEVQRINRAIEALGAVNLVALEELQTAQERHVYLQSQHDDLTLAIETLENAIRKIDRETRALLQSTFNEVNTHFGDLFPKLFGGGEAKLVMTGEEILDAGVQVMAQPPGKKNSTIQLLSGGEKALTATALVFAFFKLNPAPFCLLDEVDAPLDDANTERYANLVESMSDQTQFLFISHNKIAMQMAKQLVGVTMQEQGVSRIVAVDMAAAVEMAH